MKILLIDDSADALAVARARLANEGHELLCAGGGEEGLSRARAESPDLILLDVDMPVLSGFDVCRLLKADAATVAMPIIFLTGVGSAAEKVMGLDLGAVDYVTKPFDAFELRARVRAALRTKRLQDLLRDSARLDPLTELPNRRALDERLSQECARLGRYGGRLALVMADLDFFKRINDHCGHPVGDEALRSLARLLVAERREADLLARYGGEEFVMILPRTPLREARTVAERIRRTVRDIDPGSPVLRVSMSIGVAAYPNSNPTMDAVLRSADAALLRAKSAGRNRVYLHGEVDDRIEIADERWAELARRFAAAAHLSEAETTGLVAAIATTGLVSRPPAGADREGRRIPRTPWSPGAAGPDTMASIAMLYATEHWDGGGYPEGLRGRQIPRVARAYAVCREYLHAEQQEPRAPLRLLRARAGTVLDPGLVQRLAMALAEADGPASVSAR